MRKTNKMSHKNSPEQYQDTLERTNGLNGVTKTNKDTILKMMNLNIIHPGDGLYMVRSKTGVGQYAHVAIVTDTKLKHFVHAVPNSKLLDREYGKIVEDHFEKVVKKGDECFVVRYQQGELLGKDIAYRARTFANGIPVLKFTYDVVEANCEVVFDAAAGIWEKDRCSLQGRLVRKPFSGRGKKLAGAMLKPLQKSPKESELLDDLYWKLKKNSMLLATELRPGFPGTKTDFPGTSVGASPKPLPQEQESCSMNEIEDTDSVIKTDVSAGESGFMSHIDILEDFDLSEKGEPSKRKSSRALTKKENTKTKNKQDIEFDIKFESIPSSYTNINIFDKFPNQEKGNNHEEYQMKLEAYHTFKDNVATSRKARFILVVDKSGSMGGKPWQQVQSALTRILDLTKDSEVSCSVLSYNHNVDDLSLSGNEEVDSATINKIRANGGTNFVAVFDKLGNILRGIRDTCAYHVFFMTDGNDTRNDPSEIARSIENLQVDMEKSNTDIIFHVLGFSSDHDAEFLDSLRLIGTQDGTYTYVSPSEENEALQDRIVQLVESTSIILGRSIHIELACDEIEFLEDWFGASSNEALWPALLTKKGETTRISTTAFVRIKNVKKLEEFDISLNVYEKLRLDTKPIEGIIHGQTQKVLSAKEEINDHQLRKLRLAMNMITDRIGAPSEKRDMHEIRAWYLLLKTRMDTWTDLDTSNPTTTRLLNSIRTGIDLCDPVLEKEKENDGEEMKMKRLAVKNIYSMRTCSSTNRTVELKRFLVDSILPSNTNNRTKDQVDGSTEKTLTTSPMNNFLKTISKVFKRNQTGNVEDQETNTLPSWSASGREKTVVSAIRRVRVSKQSKMSSLSALSWDSD